VVRLSSRIVTENGRGSPLHAPCRHHGSVHRRPVDRFLHGLVITLLLFALVLRARRRTNPRSCEIEFLLRTALLPQGVSGCVERKRPR
jgi:hypothetical protein